MSSDEVPQTPMVQATIGRDPASSSFPSGAFGSIPGTAQLGFDPLLMIEDDQGNPDLQESEQFIGPRLDEYLPSGGAGAGAAAATLVGANGQMAPNYAVENSPNGRRPMMPPPPVPPQPQLMGTPSGGSSSAAPSHMHFNRAELETMMGVEFSPSDVLMALASGGTPSGPGGNPNAGRNSMVATAAANAAAAAAAAAAINAAAGPGNGPPDRSACMHTGFPTGGIVSSPLQLMGARMMPGMMGASSMLPGAMPAEANDRSIANDLHRALSANNGPTAGRMMNGGAPQLGMYALNGMQMQQVQQVQPMQQMPPMPPTPGGSPGAPRMVEREPRSQGRWPCRSDSHEWAPAEAAFTGAGAATSQLMQRMHCQKGYAARCYALGGSSPSAPGDAVDPAAGTTEGAASAAAAPPPDAAGTDAGGAAACATMPPRAAAPFGDQPMGGAVVGAGTAPILGAIAPATTPAAMPLPAGVRPGAQSAPSVPAALAVPVQHTAASVEMHAMATAYPGPGVQVVPTTTLLATDAADTAIMSAELLVLAGDDDALGPDGKKGDSNKRYRVERPWLPGEGLASDCL
jgi:hypothetical protein